MKIFTHDYLKPLRFGYTKGWLSLLAVFGFFLASQVGYGQYCTPNWIEGCDEGDMINGVSIVGLGFNQTQTGCSTSTYADYTAEEFPDLQAGESYTFVVTHGYQTQNVRVWIDFDEDFAFGDTADTELVGSGASVGNASNAVSTFIVTIPLSAEPGTYRLRMATRYSGLPIPCNTDGYGEAHDYTVTITAPNPCLKPTGLGVSAVSEDSADLFWESDGTDFDIEWGPAPFAVGEGIPATATSNELTLNDLDANATYQYYVRQACGTDGESSWAGPFNFFTGFCIPPASTYSGYNISNVTTSGGYTNILNTTGNTSSTASYGDFTALAISHSAGEEFIYNVSVPAYTNIEIWADLNQNMLFDTDELIAAHVYGDIATTFTGTIVLPDDIALGDYRIRVRSRYYYQTTASPCAHATYGETEDYTLSIVTVPTCMPPSDLAVDSVTMESADLVWEGEGTVFDIEWGEYPLTSGDGTVIENTTNPHNLSGLDPDTKYQYYVRQDCGSGESFWAGPFTFLTGYCEVSTLYTGDYTSAFSTSGAISNVTYTATAQPTGSYTNQTDQIIEQAQGLSFDFSHTYVGGGQRVNIWVDWDNDLTFDNSAESTEKVFSTYSSAATQTGNIMVPEDVEVGTYRVRVRSQWGDGANPPPCGEVSYGSTLDFTLEVLPAPTCFPPTALGVDAITFESAEIMWESDASLFDVEYGQAPIAQGEGTLLEGVTNQYTLENLDPETSYQYYVRADCGGTDGESYWSGPFTFYTGYCVPPASQYTGYIINEVTTSEGYTNILNTTGSTASPASYGIFTETPVSQSAGGAFTYGVTVPGYTNIEIWIDYDNNMIFDTEEIVAAHAYATSTTTFTGSITVPDDLELGDYRMRIRSRYYYQTTASACGPASYGETEDYILSVVSPPACLPPTGLAVDNIMMDSAELMWESDGSLFDIEWGEYPLASGDGTTIENIANPYTLSDLDPDTKYQYYVRQDCGVDGTSFWAGPFTFLTGYCEVSTTYTGDYTSAFSTSGAVTNAAYTATAQPAGSYSNQTEQVIGQAQGLSFDFSHTYYGGSQRVNIWVDWNNDLTFDNTAESTEKVFSTYSDNLTQTGTITIPEDIEVGTYRIRVRSQWGSGANPPPCGEVAYGSTIDYLLEVLPVPSCFPPTALGAENITFDSAELTWESDGTLFDIEYGPAPLTQGEGTIVEGVSNGYALSNLTPETSYQYYVRTNCGANDLSYWTGPYTFFTGYCLVSTQYTYDYTSGFSTTGAVSDVSYTASSQPVGSYVNLSDEVIEQIAGVPVNFSHSYYGGGQRVNIWVDWNHDMIFDNSAESTEKVFSVYSSNETQTGVIPVPESTETGEYRVRIRSQWGGDANPGPCGQVSYGSTLDFTLLVSPDMGTDGIDSANFKVYPNPVKDLLNLSYTENISNVEVFNMLGQQVLTKSLNVSQGQVDMSTLAAGTYMVKVTANQAVKTIKVIKQ